MTKQQMLKTAVLAIDQGTSSSRALLFDQAGQVLAQAQQEIHCRYPQDGWVEQDPEHIWQSVLTVVRQVLAEAARLQIQVQAIGITNQRETTVVWRRSDGQVLYPAIVWQDRRTAAHCVALQQAGHQAELQQKTGLCLDPYFSASKIQWLLQQVPAALEMAARGDLAFGTIDSFLIWRLTKGAVHATDTTNASRTALFDIRSLQWDEALLRLFQIPASLLPEVKQSADHYGTVDAGWFGQALPILAVAGDQQAAAIGQGCVLAGAVKSTYGTGCFALLNTGSDLCYSDQKLLTTVASTVQGQTQYALEGAIFSAGSAVKWLRDQLGIIQDAAETESLARSVNDNGGVYLVPAFTGLAAPHWRADVRAALLGLSFAAGKAHIARATLEAVVYQTVDLLQAMRSDKLSISALQIDGGMVKNDWFCQFLADLLDIPVRRPQQTETTAFGVALLAGIQLGWYANLAALPALIQIDAEFKPRMDAAQRRLLLQGWASAVQTVLANTQT